MCHTGVPDYAALGAEVARDHFVHIGVRRIFRSKRPACTVVDGSYHRQEDGSISFTPLGLRAKVRRLA
jgi:hypothetical protein